MPMVVSAVRETEDHQGGRALALDVVYNPWVLRCCREPRFRNQVRARARTSVYSREKTIGDDKVRGHEMSQNDAG